MESTVSGAFSLDLLPNTPECSPGCFNSSMSKISLNLKLISHTSGTVHAQYTGLARRWDDACRFQLQSDATTLPGGGTASSSHARSSSSRQA